MNFYRLSPRDVTRGSLAVAAGIVFAIVSAIPVMAQPGPGPFGPGPGCNVFPAPASVGASVGLSYFGPPPSATNQSLVGPVQLLKSGTIDDQKGTLTLPLYRGTVKNGNKTVWYILTDVNDANVASFLGINYSAKLGFGVNSARTANFDDAGNLVFDQGSVDFSPKRNVVPGPAVFPPQTATAGAVGSADYNPLVRVLNAGGIVYNASIVAFGVEASEINFPNGNPDYSRVHDQVLAIDAIDSTVTLNLVNGFSFGRPIWYLTMESSDATAAAIEGATFAPILKRVVLGKDDSFGSAVERLFLAVNGASEGGCDNPQRQGLIAALTDGFRPNNILGGIPTIAPDYSPLWEAEPYEWTADSIARGFRGQLREEFHLLTLVQDGLITGPGGAKFGTGSFIVNCPIAQRLN
ncbi:MAG: hypothetical protein M3Z85_18210 [Acidobacteriota bacterium]|nr:hypothetical protein [Acidobacteriota bacterium]